MSFIAIADTLFEAYSWILIIRFLLTWIPNLDYTHPVIRFVNTLTDPVVRLFQGIIPPFGNVDFSPIIMFFALRLAYSLIRNLLILVIF